MDQPVRRDFRCDSVFLAGLVAAGVSSGVVAVVAAHLREAVRRDGADGADRAAVQRLLRLARIGAGRGRGGADRRGGNHGVDRSAVPAQCAAGVGGRAALAGVRHRIDPDAKHVAGRLAGGGDHHGRNGAGIDAAGGDGVFVLSCDSDDARGGRAYDVEIPPSAHDGCGDSRAGGDGGGVRRGTGGRGVVHGICEAASLPGVRGLSRGAGGGGAVVVGVELVPGAAEGDGYAAGHRSVGDDQVEHARPEEPGDGGGEQRRVHHVEHTAEPGQAGAGVFDGRIAFEQ